MKRFFVAIKGHIATFIKGFVIGLTFRMPGISGGAIAVIIGVYNKLLHCLNNIFKEFKESFKFLSVFAVGGLIAFFALNKLLLQVTDKIPAISAYFFVGMLLCSIPSVFRETGVEYLKIRSTPKPSMKTVLKDLLPFIIGLAIIGGLGALQYSSFNGLTLNGVAYYSFIVFAGFLGGFVFILPGISFMYFLMILGVDGVFSIAVDKFDFVFLAPFAAGMVLGFVLNAMLMYRFIKKFRRQTYLVIVGFLIGSVALLLSTPKYVPVANEIGFCILALVLGGAVVVGISYISKYILNRAARSSVTVQETSVEQVAEADIE